MAASTVQWINASLPYNTISIENPRAGGFALVAERELNDGDSRNILLIDVLPPSTYAPMEQSLSFHASKTFSEPENKHTVDRVIFSLSRDKNQIKKVLDNSLHNSVIWELDEVSGSVKVGFGNHFDKQLQTLMSSGINGIYDNFPNPYYPEMNPLLKLSFLTLNFNRRGLHKRSEIIDDATRLAHSFSIYRDIQAINSDFSNLLAATVKIGLATGTNRISFPWSRARIERSFLRRYYRHLERSSRSSLYDFSSLL